MMSDEHRYTRIRSTPTAGTTGLRAMAVKPWKPNSFHGLYIFGYIFL